MSHLYDRIKKLRLKRGDVLVVPDPMTAKELSQMKWPYITFQVPIVIAPLGLERIPAEDLMKIAQRVRESSQLIIPAKI